MKYSIIFPTYDPEKKKETMTLDALESIKKWADKEHEIIIVKDVKGYSNAMNNGLHRAKGDYIIIASDDIVIEGPFMEALTQPKAIVSWRFTPFCLTSEMLPDGSIIGFSRETYNKIGDFDVDYVGGYGCDEIDWYYKAKEKGIQFIAQPFKVQHLENQTFKTYYSKEKKEMTERNINLFKSKWLKK